ncbi:hypothetical protein AB1Y20_014243 [Prymnesium parvum]|uniref:SWIM-type domain-containing protein n=1 Tax=Prymnesium parvum TaxID=97485 RepID=A0AB34IGI6_PRYPA
MLTCRRLVPPAAALASTCIVLAWLVLVYPSTQVVVAVPASSIEPAPLRDEVAGGLDAFPAPTPLASTCPAQCTLHGNCNELTGECTCPMTRRGASCEHATMPSCVAGGGGEEKEEEINFSLLASDGFWARARAGLPSRLPPKFRWLGLVGCGMPPASLLAVALCKGDALALPLPCALPLLLATLRAVAVKERRHQPYLSPCIREAVAVFSLQHAPSVPEWPSRLDMDALALQRVVCVEARETLGHLWQHGRWTPATSGAVEKSFEDWGGSEHQRHWSYVPIIAWLKQARAEELIRYLPAAPLL